MHETANHLIVLSHRLRCVWDARWLQRREGSSGSLVLYTRYLAFHCATGVSMSGRADKAGQGRKPKFHVGQIVVMKSVKKKLPFRIVALMEKDGEWFYAWNRKNYAAEHMLRELTDSEAHR
jgi:hypothetical protein